MQARRLRQKNKPVVSDEAKASLPPGFIVFINSAGTRTLARAKDGLCGEFVYILCEHRCLYFWITLSRGRSVLSSDCSARCGSSLTV